MTIAEIISGLKFTIEMFLFDPSTGEKLTEPRNNMDKITIDACKGAIKALEQQPTRPTGKWIESPNGVYVECSICGSHWEKGFVEHCNMQYCPDCGAKMTESEEER